MTRRQSERGQVAAGIFGGLGIFVLIAILVVGGFFAYWFFFKPIAVNQQAKIYQGSYGAQSADIQAAQNLVSEVATIQVQLSDPSTPASEKSSLQAQQAAETTQACNYIAQVQISLPSNLAAFAAQNC